MKRMKFSAVGGPADSPQQGGKEGGQPLRAHRHPNTPGHEWGGLTHPVIILIL